MAHQLRNNSLVDFWNTESEREIEKEKVKKRERDINERYFFKVYHDDSNRQTQPCRENPECYP